jgi:hypothetical protein
MLAVKRAGMAQAITDYLQDGAVDFTTGALSLTGRHTTGAHA